MFCASVFRTNAAADGRGFVWRFLRCERGLHARSVVWMEERGDRAVGERAERFGGIAAEERGEGVIGVEDAAIRLVDEDGAWQALAEIAQAEGVLRVCFLLFLIAEEAVLPFALRRVERGVRVMREVVERRAVLRRGSVAERDRERFFCTLIFKCLRVRCELREEFLRALARRLRQKDRSRPGAPR